MDGLWATDVAVASCGLEAGLGGLVAYWVSARHHLNATPLLHCPRAVQCGQLRDTQRGKHVPVRCLQARLPAERRQEELQPMPGRQQLRDNECRQLQGLRHLLGQLFAHHKRYLWIVQQGKWVGEGGRRARITAAGPVCSCCGSPGTLVFMPRRLLICSLFMSHRCHTPCAVRRGPLHHLRHQHLHLHCLRNWVQAGRRQLCGGERGGWLGWTGHGLLMAGRGIKHCLQAWLSAWP